MMRLYYLAIGSVLVLLGLAAALAWREHTTPTLIVYSAPKCRLPLEKIVADYERETGIHVELRSACRKTSS